jgi:hypothetical protein
MGAQDAGRGANAPRPGSRHDQGTHAKFGLSSEAASRMESRFFITTLTSGLLIGIVIGLLTGILHRHRRSSSATMTSVHDLTTEDGIARQTEDEVFDEVRLVRDFLGLIWDMAVRWYTWDWETAKASFGFYREAAAYKFRRTFG